MRSTVLTTALVSLVLWASSAWGLSYEPSVPPQLAQRIRADLGFVELIRGGPATPLHRKVFGETLGTDDLIWFENRVERIGYTHAIGEQRGTTAYNDSADGQRHHIVVTDWFARPDMPQIARISILFHEARHSEESGAYWPHRKCPKPFRDANGREMRSSYTGLPLAGEYACDATALGAYGVSVIMLMNLAHSCQNCNEKVRNDAAFYAADQLQRLLLRSDRERIKDDAK